MSSDADTIELDIFIVNLDTKEVHHSNCETGSCQLEEIQRVAIAQTLAEARKVYGADLCAHCFRSKK